MKIELINGEYHIVLNKDEKILLTPSEREEDKNKQEIAITTDGNKINMSGNDELFGTIDRGTLSNMEIIELCDIWGQYFLDAYSALIDTITLKDLSDDYIVELKVERKYTDNKATGKRITLGLRMKPELCDIFNEEYEGAILELDDVNDDIFRYIFAVVVDNYLNMSYGPTIINDYSFVIDSTISPVRANLKAVNEFGDNYKVIVTNLIVNHNLGIIPDNLFKYLEKNISDQVIKNYLLNKSIEKTKLLYEELNIKRNEKK